MRILIVGGGKVAEELLNFIDLKKHQVYLVEKNLDRRQELMSKFDVFVIGKDATDVSLYASDINMEQIDMVIALTSSDEVNLLVLAIAKIYDVPHRIARVTDRRIADLIRELGLGIPISQPSIIASTIRNYMIATTSSLELTSFNIGKNIYYLYLVSLAETDFAAGTKLNDLNLPEDVRVLLVFDGISFKPPSENEELKPGYQLIVLSSTKDVERYFKG